MYDGCGYVVAKSLNDVKPDKIAKMGVDEALSKIGGTSIASGNYKVIINNEAMVSLFYQLLQESLVGMQCKRD